MKDAISDFSSDNFDLIWRPFQLNPDMPLEGMERKKYLELKFGGQNNYKNIYENIYNVGLENNVHFQFEKIAKTPNSFASHKLLALAYKSKKQTQVVETLFYNYFIEGVDIGDIKELVRISKQHNIYQDDISVYLQSKEDRDNLLAEESHAKELGVTGVPCFIINKEFVLFGAQEKKNFLEIFLLMLMLLFF